MSGMARVQGLLRSPRVRLIAAGSSLALVWAPAAALPLADAAPASSAQTTPGQGAPPPLELVPPVPPASAPTSEAAPMPALELAPAPATPLATEPSGQHLLERWWFWTAVVAVGLTAFLAIAATSLSTPGAPSTELGNRVAF
jgi:hypothetical protein